MPAYFQRLDATRFASDAAVQGAWNIEEQHIAPSFGLLTHVLELDHAQRHEHPLTASRLSFDILGTLPIDEVEVTTRVLRPGRTIELLEATLSHGGRPAVVARAWFLADRDTSSFAGSALPGMPAPDTLEPWQPGTVWPGEFVTTVDVRREQLEPGRARVWLRPVVPLLEGEPVSSTARTLGVVDIANGMTPRQKPTEVMFPNLDLTAHLFREPQSEWIGFDTTVSFGPAGHGLTHTVLHDEHGPLGTSQQSLTVRPIA